MQQCLSDSPKRKTFLAISVSHTTLKSILRICLCLLRVCVCCAGPKKYLLPYRRWTRGYGGHKLYFLKLTVSCAARERHWERTLWQLLPSVLSSQSQELPELSLHLLPRSVNIFATLERLWSAPETKLPSLYSHSSSSYGSNPTWAALFQCSFNYFVW